MEQKSKNWLLLGLLGLAGFIVWKSSKAKTAPLPTPNVKDDGFSDDPDYGKPLTKETLKSALVDPLTLGKTACTTCKFYRPDGNYYTKEALENSPVTVAYLERYSKVSPHVDVRPNFDMECSDLIGARSNPNCQSAYHVRNAHLVDKGTLKYPTLESLSVEEFLNMSDQQQILIDGKLVPKGHYVEYTLKGDPITLAPSIEQQLKIAEPFFEKPKNWVVVKQPFYDNQDPLNRMQPLDVILKYDPDGVEEKMRTYGRDCCTTGYRGAQVYYTVVGNSGYSETKVENGVKYGVPIVGATASYIVTAKDNLLDENGQPIVDEEGYQYWKYYKDVDKETAIQRGWVNYKKVAGAVLYKNDYVMSESGEWIPVKK